MSFERLAVGACHRGRASIGSLFLHVAVELAEPDHLCLNPDEKPHHKGANRLTPNSGTWESHNTESFEKTPYSFRRALYILLHFHPLRFDGVQP